jgi:hypothetical protein
LSFVVIDAGLIVEGGGRGGGGLKVEKEKEWDMNGLGAIGKEIVGVAGSV